MKKSIKLVSILMMAIMIIMIAMPTFAAVKPDDVTISANMNDIDSDDTIKGKAGKIIGTLQWIGIVGGVIIMAIFGIKYMMGSIEEKAEYKKTMVPYIVGAVVVMAAPQIAKLIFNMVA